MHILEKVETYQKETIEKIIKNGENAQKRGIVFFGDSHIQYFDVKKYLVKLYEKDYKSTSVGRKISSLRAFYSYLKQK